ncbi:MAG: enoyl-CoA hydratase/isomerase family protein [Polaromonas sp.]|uniref:enoyl-CoA hydratase/isomerase family protein n=1 Tax=Polaromonas sp. TaxID=1869339 RepID=UPI0032648DCF
MSEPKLLTNSRDGVLTLTLNRPEKLNAVDNDLSRSLLQALEAGATDETVRVIRLRGNGRAFCAGRDVGAPPTEDDLVLVQAVAQSIVRNPKLVLAEVHGWTVGAGFEWMLDADVVIAAETTRFKLPEASLGVFVTGGLSVTLPAAVGLARAKALTLLGEEFTAHQALAWGLVWKVVEDSGLDEASWNAAVKLATLKPVVAAQFKRVFNLLGLAAFDRAIEEENGAQRLLGPQ